MKYVVACVCALLGTAAGILALMMVDRYREQLNTADAEDAQPADGSWSISHAATAFFVRAKSMTAKEWGLILLAAVLVGAVALRLQNAQTEPITGGRLLVTALLLLPMMVIDWHTHRIPNALVLTMLAAGTVFLAMEFFLTPEIFRNQLVSCILGLAGFLVLFYVMARLTRGGIGMGDVKLIAAEGWMTGFVITLASTMFSLLVCSAVATVLLFTKKKNSNDQVPFGPFLFFGYVLSLLICNL